MGFFSWLFRSLNTIPAAKIIWQVGSFPMEAVGESYYQEALQSICGPFTRDGHESVFLAIIQLEPTNPHDSNAVVIKIRNRIVGYLPRDQALRVGSQMRSKGISAATCNALIRGGWRTNQYDEGLYGVRLSIPKHGEIEFDV